MPASNGSRLILASTSSASSSNLQYFQSTDGITWTERATQDGTTGQSSSGTPNAACYAMGKFYLFATYSIYSSADGVNWTYHYAPSNGFSKTSLFATNGGTLFAFQSGSQSLRYFSSPSDLKFRNLQPAGSHVFTAAATFGTKVLYGTDKGLLGLAADPFGVVIPREKSSTLQSMEFTENLFIARTTNVSFSNSAAIDQVSGDGVTWKQNTPLDTPNVLPTGSASGKYYGNRSFSTGIHSGHNPFDVRSNPNDSIGLAPNISFIGQLPNGTALAVSSPASGPSTLHTRAAGATAWAAATFPLALNSASKFASLGDRWFSHVGSFSSGLIYTSSNGSAWTSTGLTGSNPHFASVGGKSWCVYQSATFPMTVNVASSTNGTAWAGVAVTGLPGNHYSSYIRRVVAFGNFLVLLGTDENLYFSQDGANWLRGFTPGKVVDIAAGNGQLVAAMKNGGIIQTGAPHPGGSAPLVSIVSPQTAGTHLIGSQITVEGTVSDPEDGTASYDCYLDSEIVASGTGNSFRFTVTTTDPNGHTVTVRARDSHGLRQMDSIRLKVAAAEPENLLANIQGGAVPARFAAALDGVFYAAAARSIHRSLDGKTWEKMPIPSFANSIYGMAAGNGSLVIQFDNGAIMTTRDGVNWTHFSPNLTSYWVREPIRFSAGVFIAAYQTQGTITGSVMTSADGLRWETGTISTEGYLSWTTNGDDGTIIGAVAYQYGISRTVDNGYNWLPIAPLSTGSAYNSHGVFAGGKYVVAISSSNGGINRLFVSGNSTSWNSQALPATITNTPALGHIGGRYLLGGAPYFSHISTNATSWQPMSHSVHNRKITHARGLFVAEASTGGIVTSRDGITWTPVTGPPSAVSNILSNESAYLLIGADGSVWLSPDGEKWENTMPGGTPTGIDYRLGQSVAELKGRIVAGGGGLLVTSADNGRTWANTTVNGLPPSTNNSFNKVVAGGSAMLALESTSSQTILQRSTNGSAFAAVSGLPVKTWVDLAWNGTAWMLLGSDGSLFRSTDGGLTWAQLAVTGIARGAGLAWFNGNWVVIGAETTSSSSPYTGYILGAGDVLVKHAVIGFYNSIYPVRTLIAHGKLLVWTRGESTFVSTNGISWAAANLNAGAGNHDYDIYHTPDGFTAFVGSTTAYYPVQAWSAGQDGLAWAAIPSPFNSIQYADNLGEQVFLFARGSISVLRDKDLALTLPPLANITRGVGDQVAARVTIRNLGRTLPSGGKWRVTAWLAKNRFFGDTKNVPLGTSDITAPMPAAGASAQYDVSFTLPNEVLTGANHLILSLSSVNGVVESNTANNTAISDTAFVTIPEWEFSVATNGNGQVNRDFSSARYPHKAQVSLTASAGKGATFTGWAGDAVSPNNQITILMNGHKSVQANFANRATLQVSASGMGEVTGLPDFGSYAVGATAAITAVPAPGWVFSHWSGATSKTARSISILMDKSKTVTAHFVLPMAAWKKSHFTATQLANSAISGDNMDPDKDGVPTWMEYLHGSDPMDANSTGATPFVIEGGYLRTVYTRNLGAEGGASLTCQGGRNLETWNSPDLQERILFTVDGIQTVEARLPVAMQATGFLRFRYIRAQP
jgi:hypothetical protein